jgi:hypothetical protein
MKKQIPINLVAGVLFLVAVGLGITAGNEQLSSQSPTIQGQVKEAQTIREEKNNEKSVTALAISTNQGINQ